MGVLGGPSCLENLGDLLKKNEDMAGPRRTMTRTGGWEEGGEGGGCASETAGAEGGHEHHRQQRIIMKWCRTTHEKE